jgi:putative tricarboxylic transport membrane protein
MLDAITVHGLQPGPGFFNGNPVTAEFFLAMFLSQIVFAVFGILLAPFLARGAYVPSTILAPLVIVAGCVGAYSINGSIGDIVMALIFGLIGFIIMKLKFPLAPMCLGAILGPLAESNYRRALIIAQVSGRSPFLAPLPIILAILILAMVIFIVYDWHKESKGKAREERGDGRQAPL